MRPLEAFPSDARRRIRFVLLDLDDTLTLEGRMPAASYGALERGPLRPQRPEERPPSLTRVAPVV